MPQNSPFRMRSSVRLSRLLSRISELFDEKITPNSVWVRAEISSVNRHGSGHIYFEFVETEGEEQTARCRAVLWRTRHGYLKNKYGEHYDEVFREGREVVCEVHVVFHPVHGMSLNISDIDRDFSLGESERRRRECILRLQREGLLTRNAELPVPPVIQRIALIAASQSAGLADITRQLESNRYGYRFSIEHLPASVQGQSAVPEITAALNRIDPSAFDVIVVVRGGGATLDLEAFNEYELNAAMSRAPLPLVVGIGHETDRTVLDEVAAVSLKTPSAVGAWIVERNREFDIRISTVFQSIRELYRQKIDQARSRWQNTSHQLIALSGSYAQSARHQLLERVRQLEIGVHRDLNEHRQVIARSAMTTMATAREINREQRIMLRANRDVLERAAGEATTNGRSRLKGMEALIDLYHPEHTLARGYALLRKNGSIVTNIEQLKPEDQLDIETTAHRLSAQITKISDK